MLGAVKRVVDKGAPAGSLLLTGSIRASLESATWPGTGRVIHLDMHPMTVLERQGWGGAKSDLLDLVFDGDAASIPLSPDVPDLVGYVAHALCGGYPPAVELDDRSRRTWLDSYVDQLVLRDAPELAHTRDPAGLRRLLRALGEHTAGIAADTAIAAAADVNVKTAQRNERLLEDLRIVTSVPSWHSNRISRMVKARKRYVVDPGLGAAVLGIDADAVLTHGGLLGRMIDTFVMARQLPARGPHRRLSDCGVLGCRHRDRIVTRSVQPPVPHRTSFPQHLGRSGGPEEAVVARFGRRRLVIGGIAVVAVLVAGFAVALSGDGSGGGTSSSAVAPSSGGVETARDSAGVTVGADAASAPAVGLTAPAPDQVPSQSVPVGGVQRSLVRTAQLTVEVRDAGASARQVRTAAAAVGGFVTEEQSGTGGGFLVLRVPADALDRLIEDIGRDLTVTGRSTQVVDATEQVVDLDARVASQQASVARVRVLLGQATSIGDIVSIESELSRREADLDSLTGRLAALRDQVALSTLTIDLRTPSTPITEGDGQPAGFLGGLASGWDGLRALGAGVGAVVGFVLPFLPVLAVLLGIGWLARRIVRTRRTPATAGAGRSGPGSEGES